MITLLISLFIFEITYLWASYNEERAEELWNTIFDRIKELITLKW